MATFRGVTIPLLLSKRPTDERGFPIPFTVLIDATGKPNFKINDDRKTTLTITEKRCHICGSKVDKKSMWMVGGMLSAFHPRGAFVEAPAHYDCCVFALKICPYMAFSQYSSKGFTLPDDGIQRIYVNPTMTDERLSFFVLAKTTGFTAKITSPTTRYVYPKRPYVKYELWLDGNLITYEQAIDIMRAKGEENYLPAK